MAVTQKPPKLAVYIRWMILHDYPEVLAIENASFDTPWTEEDFKHHLRQRAIISMVAEHGNTVVGYMVYDLQKRAIQLLNFAVHPGYRRHGVGRQMLNRLASKLSKERRSSLWLQIHENNLPAQLFFRSYGFIATEVLRRHCLQTGADCYVMEYEPPDLPSGGLTVT